MEIITIGNIIQIFLFAGAIIGVYVRAQVKQKELEMKIKTLEDRTTRVEQEDHHIYKKLDQITQMLTDIKVQLANKLDRE